jgi:hypothetical protein
MKKNKKKKLRMSSFLDFNTMENFIVHSSINGLKIVFLMRNWLLENKPLFGDKTKG